ncbi:unnamed protein product, partial [Prorocentrum cordatum]
EEEEEEWERAPESQKWELEPESRTPSAGCKCCARARSPSGGARGVGEGPQY